MAGKITITCKLEAEHAARLDELATKVGMTRSELSAHCLAYGIREGEKFADRMQKPVVGHFLRMVYHLDTDDPEEVARFEDMWKSLKQSRKGKGPKPHPA